MAWCIEPKLSAAEYNSSKRGVCVDVCDESNTKLILMIW